MNKFFLFHLAQAINQNANIRFSKVDTDNYLTFKFVELMAAIKKDSEPLDNLSSQQIEDIVRSNEILDQENERLIKEEEIEAQRFSKTKSTKRLLRRLRRSPLEVINRSLFFVFIGSFIFSFVSVYSINKLWFIFYVISAFSCVLYTPNRQALKELIAAWPNIEDLLKKRSLWK